jgi:hypothetical protein
MTQLQFVVDTGNGAERKMSSKEIVNYYGQFSGMQPLGLTMDGSSGVFSSAQGGIQTIPIHEMLGQNGMQIKEFYPENAIPAENIMKYRMSMETISDPDVREAYLKTVASKDFGIENPLITGQGSDRYLWNPNEGQWIALTNQQGFDASDLAGGVIGSLRGTLPIAGSIVGGGLAGLAASPTGPGALLAGAGGAGVGGGLGAAAAEAWLGGGMSAIDPNLRSALAAKGSQGIDNEYLRSLSGFAKTEGRQIGTNVVLGAGMGAAGPVLGRALRPLSTGLQGIGSGVKGVGQMARATGEGLGTPVGRMGLQIGLDPTGISGVGALGGAAKDFAQPIAQGAVKGFDALKRGIHAVRGTEGPTMQFAGENFAQTAKNLPNLGRFVSGVENVGKGLETVGRGVENVYAGGLKYGGAATSAAGSALRGLGKVGSVVETPAYLVAAQRTARGLDPEQSSAQFFGGSDNPGNGYQRLDSLDGPNVGAQGGGYYPVPSGQGGLGDYLAQTGGLARILGRN